MTTAAILAVVAAAIAGGDAQAQQIGGAPTGKVGAVVRRVAVVNGKSLSGFHRALRELEEGKRPWVRVFHLGDSHVAADLWPGYTRQVLQRRFGDGGPGYLLPLPHGSAHEGPTQLRAGPGFETRRLGFAKVFGPTDGAWGLAGVAMEGSGPGAWFEVEVPALPGGSSFEVHVRGQNPGGQLAIAIDGRRPDVVDTFHASRGLVKQMWPLAPGPHRIKGRVASAAPVRVLGFVVESRRPGVIYDTLGINGHRVTAINQWSTDLLAAQFRQRQPDLVILGYGCNEGLSTMLTLEQYERELRTALVTLRRLAPRASCLLTGPVAMCPERQGVTKIIEVQRRIGPEYGCGFWDSSAVSGGPGSLCQWVAADSRLVAGDRLHLRKLGYQLIAQELTRAILAGYEPPGKSAP
jgi:lysophospholipase L1-like esterase